MVTDILERDRVIEHKAYLALRLHSAAAVAMSFGIGPYAID